MKIKRIEICGFKSFVDKTSISFPRPDHVDRRSERLRQVERRRRHPLGHGRAVGQAPARPRDGGRHLRRLGDARARRVRRGLAHVRRARRWARTRSRAASPGARPGPRRSSSRAASTATAQSEYLLNGVPSRLRDVVEFFLGTGVGSKAYAIIEQGRIGFIVSSRAEDRRGLIDEAAGITKYKAKKKAAEQRMESTRQHLLRVSDIVAEIERRLRSLRLQAQKAERYKRYKAELRDLDLWSSAQRYLGHLAEEKSAIAELAEVRERHDDRRGRAGGRGGLGRGRAPGGRRGGRRAGHGEGRAVRAVEQGPARDAAGRAPRVRGAAISRTRAAVGAQESRSCAPARRRGPPDVEADPAAG